MSKSYRDKRAHKARKPEMYFNVKNLPTLYGGIDWLTVLFENGIYPTKNTPKIAWAIQGKRRRNSSRKANQKTKQMIHQKERSKLKQELRQDIQNNYKNDNNFLRGHITKEGDYSFVNFYTCNGRCITVEHKHEVQPEVDKCCEAIKFLLDKESQTKVKQNDQIYFTILETVTNPFNNWLGLYAKYERHY